MLFASIDFNVYKLYERGGKGQNETSQNMFLFWEETMFRLLCYGRPPYSKHISVVASSYGYFGDFYIKKIASALAFGRTGGGDFCSLFIPDLFLSCSLICSQ